MGQGVLPVPKSGCSRLVSPALCLLPLAPRDVSSTLEHQTGPGFILGALCPPSLLLALCLNCGWLGLPVGGQNCPERKGWVCEAPGVTAVPVPCGKTACPPGGCP